MESYTTRQSGGQVDWGCTVLGLGVANGDTLIVLITMSDSVQVQPTGGRRNINKTRTSAVRCTAG